MTTPKTYQQWAVFIVILLAVLGCLILAVNHFAIPIPPIFWNLFWIVVGAVVLIFVIKFLFGLGGGDGPPPA